MTAYSATIDVPDLARGIAFCASVFDLAEAARPVPVHAILTAEALRLGIMEKPEGSRPTPGG